MARRKTRHQSSDKLSARQYAKALIAVGVTTYRAAPAAATVQLIGSAVTAVLPLVITYFAAKTTTALADAYAGKEEAGEQAIEFVIVTALLGVLLTAWNSIEQYISQAMRYRVEAAMTDRMYAHFFRLDFWRYDDKDTVDLYEKARKFAQFFPYIFDRLSSVITSVFSLTAGVIALVVVSWWLGILALFALIPGIVIQFRLSRLQSQHWNDTIETRRRFNMIEWNLFEVKHMAELRLYGVVRRLLNLRKELRDADEKARIDFERRFVWKRLGADVIEAVAEVVALVWTALQIIAHTQPIGQFLYVQQIMSRVVGGAASLVSSINSIDEDIANLFDYQRFVELPEQISGDLHLQKAPQLIEVKDVSFSYPQSDKEVLRGITITIKSGQHVAIVGENGAGKTTFMKILTGLYAPARGDLVLDGTPLRDISIDSWHKQLAVLDQQFINYSFATAKENIVYGDVSREFDQLRFDKAVDNAEAREFIEKLPRGFDNYVNQWMEGENGHKGQDLSGGQWQRLALARNFYRDSPVIILDEPTSAIDALAEARIFEHLFKQYDKTIITVSHRLSTIKKADVIYMMKDGKVIEQGTYDKLIKQGGEFYAMFESQL